MKKEALLFLTLFSGLISFGQKGFDAGVFGSIGSSFIWRQNNYGTLAPFNDQTERESELAYKFTTAATVGINLGYNFTKNWGVLLGIQYATAGQNYEDNFTGPAYLPDTTLGSISTNVNVKRVVKLSYMQIPLLVKFMAGKSRIGKFFVELGPQFGVRTSAYEQVQIGHIVYLPDSINFTSAQKFQSFDAGITLKFGADLYVTKHLYIELGITGYEGIYDINGKILQQLGWYDKNHVKYQPSHNANAEFQVGLHYIFGEGRAD